MRFRILGPLRIDGPDGPMTFRSPQRMVVGLLLARAGCAVPDDELIHVLWGPRPPDNARSMLGVLLSRLRTRFSGDNDLRILTVGRRHRLAQVRAGELDLAVFRRLVGEARLADTPADACAALQRALGLWRGPALSCVSFFPMWTAVGAALFAERQAALALQDKFRRLAGTTLGPGADDGTGVPLRHTHSDDLANLS